MTAPKTKKPKQAKDGTPYPPDFNRWSNADRLYWLEEHSGIKCPCCGLGTGSLEHKENCEL